MYYCLQCLVFTPVYGYMVHFWTFAVVPTNMLAIHQVSRKHTIFHVFIIYEYMYVARQDKSCRYCYDLCRGLRLFSLYSCAFTVVPTNMGKYHVLSVKHTIVGTSVVDFLYWYMIDPPCLGCFFVSMCTEFGVLSRPSYFTNSVVPF